MHKQKKYFCALFFCTIQTIHNAVPHTTVPQMQEEQSSSRCDQLHSRPVFERCKQFEAFAKAARNQRETSPYASSKWTLPVDQTIDLAKQDINVLLLIATTVDENPDMNSTLLQQHLNALESLLQLVQTERDIMKDVRLQHLYKERHGWPALAPHIILPMALAVGIWFLQGAPGKNLFSHLTQFSSENICEQEATCINTQYSTTQTILCILSLLGIKEREKLLNQSSFSSSSISRYSLATIGLGILASRRLNNLAQREMIYSPNMFAAQEFLNVLNLVPLVINTLAQGLALHDKQNKWPFKQKDFDDKIAFVHHVITHAQERDTFSESSI